MSARADNCNRADGALSGAAGNPSDAGSAWAGGVTHYAIAGNAIKNVDGTFEPIFLECSAVSGTAKGTWSVGSHYFALAVRGADVSNYLLAYYDGSWTLYKVVGGSFTSIGTNGTTITTADYVEFAVTSGNVLTVSKNGGAAFLGPTTESAGGGNTKHGLLLYADANDRIDDWFWTDAGGGGTDTPLNAQPGTFTETGSAATLKIGLAASPATFTETGTAATLGVGLAASPGSFTETGTAATFTITLNASAGSFALTGFAATLTAGGNVSMSASPGVFVTTGFSATLGIGLAGGTGSAAATGSGAGFGVGLAAAAGAFTLTGYAATLVDSGAAPPTPGGRRFSTRGRGSAGVGVTGRGGATFTATGDDGDNNT